MKTMKEKLPNQTKNKIEMQFFSLHQRDDNNGVIKINVTIHCTCTAYFGEKHILSEFQKGVKDE